MTERKQTLIWALSAGAASALLCYVIAGRLTAAGLGFVYASVFAYVGLRFLK